MNKEIKNFPSNKKDNKNISTNKKQKKEIEFSVLNEKINSLIKIIEKGKKWLVFATIVSFLAVILISFFCTSIFVFGAMKAHPHH